MPRAFVSQVEVNGIPGKQSAHERPETGRARPEQKVKVIGHQRPGEALGISLDKELRKPLKESPSIVIVTEDVAAVNTSDDDMLQKVRYV